jgi:hypothetical protein
MWLSRRYSNPSFFQACSKRRMYRFGRNGEPEEPWGLPPPPAIPSHSRPAPDTISVGFLDSTFQSDPDRMWHASIGDTSHQRAHQLHIRDAAEVIGQLSIDHVCLPPVKPPLYLLRGLLIIAAFSWQDAI